MAQEGHNPLIKLAKAGLCSAIAGPLGAVVGGFTGGFLGDAAGELAKAGIEKLTEVLADAGADSLTEKLKKSRPTLEIVYRQTLRASLAKIKDRAPLEIAGPYKDWFANWDLCLKDTAALKLDEIQPSQLATGSFDERFRNAMQRLDAQGTAIAAKDTSLKLETRTADEALLTAVKNSLPDFFEDAFRELIVEPEQIQAWNQLELNFRDWLRTKVDKIDTRTELMDAKLDELLRRTAESAEKDNRITRAEALALEAKAEAEEWKKKFLELTKSDPPLEELLSTGDFADAARRKTQQIEKQTKTRQAQTEELARSYRELGLIHELQFKWDNALAAYRQAWELSHDPEHGFQYAYFAQKLNRFNESIVTYEALLRIYTDPADRATTLNNLAVLYRDIQRIAQAEEAYNEALSIRRTLAMANPDAYLPDVAETLNNLAVLYSALQRMAQAEEAYNEALATYRILAKANPDTYLPYVATTLNNLAVLYRDIQRMAQAEEAYNEALATYRTLAKANPDAHLPDVAMTLNNLGLLYRDIQRMAQAEEVYHEALATYRTLAMANPDAWLPNIAMTLNNLAALYYALQRMAQAEEAWNEALATYQTLARASPDAYLPDVAMTLNNLAALYYALQRMAKAEETFSEALATYRTLARANPDVYLPYVAATLNNLGLLYSATQRIAQAEDVYNEALAIRRTLAKANPDAYLPDVATTLNNLGLLYRDLQRTAQAEEAHNEALAIRRTLARANPDAYLPDVAMSLNNLAILYSATQRMAKAEESLSEALATYRTLAKANPDAYLPYVATTLNNLAYFHLSNENRTEASKCASEAEILAPLWQANPALHGNNMAKTLWTRALIAEATNTPEACALARRALAAAFAPALKQPIQRLIDRLCPEA